MRHNWHTLSVSVAGPATEVRLFSAGWNSTTKGRVLFDERAARDVMAAYQAHAVEITIDLEHLSLDRDSRNYDPDARGSGKLELRDGELWLTAIRWTPEGQKRLVERRQRFVSPAFLRDAKTLRVQRVHNVAICAQPATDGATPLIAASKGSNMDPKLIKDALDALEAGDSAKALEILKALIASAAGAADAAPEGDALMDEPAPDEEKAEEMAASVARIAASAAIAAAARKATGKDSPDDVMAVLTALSASRGAAGDMATELATLRASVLRGELRELVRANPRKIAGPKLEALVLASDSVEAARVLVEALPEVVADPVRQPVREPAPDAIRLTDEDREVCRLTGTPEEALLKFKTAQAARR